MPVSAAPPAFPGVFAMRPTRPLSGKSDLFRERLEVIIDPHHALVRLAGLVPWSHFEEAFGRFYRPIGRPAKPTRLMVGLHYLKHVHDLSDEEVVARWVENPYWQFFCGFEFFQHEVPLDASTMTRWRKRIGPAGLEEMLKASVGVALDTGVAKPGSLERVSVDTTVQPKAIAHPTDSRLYWKALQILVRQAKRHGVTPPHRAIRGWPRRRWCGPVATPMPGSFAGCGAPSSSCAPIWAACSAMSAARSPATRHWKASSPGC